MPIRQFLNRTDFSNPDTALDLYGNSLRSAFTFDVYQGKTVFEAVVLTRPIFMVDAYISPEGSADASGFRAVQSRETGRLDKFMFKGRILPGDAPSPHEYLPDPCDIQVAEEYDDISKLYNLHTTFISSDDYTRSNSTLPKVGDVVKVELVGNVHSYNLQYGTFINVKSTGPGYLPRGYSAGDSGDDSPWDCRVALRLFSDSDFMETLPPTMSDEEMRTIARQYLTRMRSDAGNVNVTFTREDAFAFVESAGVNFGASPPSSGLSFSTPWASDPFKGDIAAAAGLVVEKIESGESGRVSQSGGPLRPVEATVNEDGTWSMSVPKKFFLTGTDSTGVTYDAVLCGPYQTRIPAFSSLSTRFYTLAKCADCTIGGRTGKLHPDFCKFIKNAVNAAKAAVPAATVNLDPNVRTTETQLKLRIQYACGTDYNGIISNRPSVCRVMAAKPGTSNHEIGMAADLGGTLTQGGTRAAAAEGSAARNSELFRWMMANVHDKSRLPGTTAPTDDSEDTGIINNIKNLSAEPWHWSWNGG